MKSLRNKVPKFNFVPFSKKQLQLLTWWKEGSPYSAFDVVIADGSIRSGKTVSMALSFKRNSPSAQKARTMALERGGILMEEKPMSRTVRILNAKGETERTIEG